MVGRWVLVPKIGVRIPVPQPCKRPTFVGLLHGLGIVELEPTFAELRPESVSERLTRYVLGAKQAVNLCPATMRCTYNDKHLVNLHSSQCSIVSSREPLNLGCFVL